MACRAQLSVILLDIAWSGTGNRVILLTIVLLVVCQRQHMLVTGEISLFLPLIRQEVSVGVAQGDTLTAASTLVYARTQIPVDHLADRVYGSEIAEASAKARLPAAGKPETNVAAL
jgi:hypothetical protein